jgi:hypothetical protein
MADGLERIARVGLAGWVGERADQWDAPPVLGIIGDDLYLVEIDAGNRERVLLQLIDRYEAPPRSAGAAPLALSLFEGDDRSLRIEVVFFGDAGGFFASSMNFLELWPKSPAGIPAEVFVDNHHRAAFTKSGDDIVVSVRHALRPSAGPPKRLLRFLPEKYEAAMSELARESRRLRDDLIAIAQERAPQKVESLQEGFRNWPA